jgi:3-oxoacyl-[acyl-carrier-protein] synthase-3
VLWQMNLEESKVLMNIEKYGNTTSALPLVLYDFEHLFKKEIQLFWLLLEEEVSWGSVYLKWAYDKK